MGEKSKKTKKPPKRPLTYAAKGVDVTLGHQHCVPGGRFPRVPREMGWLWTSKDVPGLQYRPDWRPGAVRRSVSKLIKRYSKNVFNSGPEMAAKIKKKLSTARALPKGSRELDHDHEDDKIAPSFVIQNIDGDYYVTLQEFKDIKTRKVTDYPYTDGPPYKFKMRNNTDEEMRKIDRNRERARKYAESLMFQEAFDNICKEIYDKIDKEELCNYALQKDSCVCQALQAEILNNFTSSLADVSGLCSPIEKQSCGEEEWRIEFTPPIARFDPNRKVRVRVNKATQYDTRGMTDDDDDANKWKRQLENERSLSDVTVTCDVTEPGAVLDDSGKVEKKKRKKKNIVKEDGRAKVAGGGAGTFLTDKDKFVECTPVVDDTCCVCTDYCKDYPCCYDYCFAN